jgi:tetratricopeptide (TPR) repeat protein
VELRSGNLPEALAAARRAVEIAPDYDWGKSDSDAALKKLITDGAASVAYEIAAVYCYRHELDEAMRWLDRAYAQRDAFLIYIKGDPSFKNLETDPRFKAYLRKLKLPE